MRNVIPLLALSLATIAPQPSQALDLDPYFTLFHPANRIVGLWRTQGEIRPCGSDLPFSTIFNTLLFHAGGTVVENPRIPPDGILTPTVPGVNQRGQALGTWAYDWRTRRYTVNLRFDWYVDGIYHGYGTVEREIILNQSGAHASGPVRSARHLADGSVLGEVCGSAVSERL